MVPRFFRTFLVIAILLFVPTTYLVYTQTSYSHPTSTTSFSSSGGNIEDDLLSREDHWDKGGSYPGALRVKESDLDELGGMYSSSRIKSNDSDDDKVLSEEMMINGKIIMPKLSNATAKAELGRAAWKLLHLVTLRYPENPTPDERTALSTYLYLFARLYPCGECAEEFQKLLKDYPPQTSSRKTASVWLCSIHNMVNARLGKEEFDCNDLDGVYDCGCGDAGVEVEDAKGEEEQENKTEEELEEVEETVEGKKSSGFRLMEDEERRDTRPVQQENE